MSWLSCRSASAFGLFLGFLALAPGCDRQRVSTTTPSASAEVPTTASSHPIDALLDAAWAREGITAAPRVDDAGFLRRVYLDLVGVVPTAKEASAFLADERADKRERLVDELLVSPRFAKHWTNYWDDVLMESGKNPFVDRIAFRQWLVAQLAGNVPYDVLVRDLLTATGVNSAGGKPDLAAWELEEPAKDGVNGAVNFVLSGAKEPQNLAGKTARVFLGVQIQCAECHDHPTETWTQSDFEKFTSAFMRVKSEPLASGRMGLRRLEVSDAEEVSRPIRRRMRRTGYGDEAPQALDGTPLDRDHPRQALATWLTAKSNPRFARAIVNRLWGYFVGSGFVEPIDDISEKSDIRAPEVLDAMSAELVRSGYDLRHMMRLITTSSAYQRAPKGAAPLWSSFALRPMNDTQLLDSLVTATGIEPLLEDVMGARLTRLKTNLRRQFRFTFDVDEEASADTFTGTTPQALMLLNGGLTMTGSRALAGSTIDGARTLGSEAQAVEALYLATLSRKPEPAEASHWQNELTAAAKDGARPLAGRGAAGPVGRVQRQKRLRDAGPNDAVYEDMLWALLNSSEFFFIH